jgi:glycosyltransferase involved in cell wall biosynthesis
MLISLVVPIFNEDVLIRRLHEEIDRAVGVLGEPIEIVYVNDGSTDRSLELLKEAQARDARVVVIDLSRNWGHQAALSAGLSVAKGDAVVLMDGDLQDPPSVIVELVAVWKQGAEVVVAERRSRLESGLRGALFPLFYRMLGFLSDYPIPLNAGIFGLLDRGAVDAVNALSETNRYLPGLRAWVGFTTRVVLYDRRPRAAGEPKQSLLRLFHYALDAILSFSYKPLRLSLFAGFLVAGLAVGYGVVLTICRLLGTGLFGYPVVVGYTSTIVAILFLGGTQLISVGILGEYLGRVYDEVKRRPLFVIREVFRTAERA